jgi:gluconolactonase
MLPDGRVLFVETFKGRLSVWDPAGEVRNYACVGGGPNSCTIGLDGVYVAQNGGTAGDWKASIKATPCIQRIGWDGEVEVVTSTIGRRPLHAPNDLAFGSDGFLYFTDPGDFDPLHPIDGRICVADINGSASVLVETGPSYPNGLAFESDGCIVWDESYTRCVRRWHPDGSVDLVTTLPDGRVPDGLKVAKDGRIFIAGGPIGGIDILSPQGDLVGFLETGGDLTNCVFDGADLYVTCMGMMPRTSETGYASSGGRLLRVRQAAAGLPLARGAIATDRGTAT